MLIILHSGRVVGGDLEDSESKGRIWPPHTYTHIYTLVVCYCFESFQQMPLGMASRSNAIDVLGTSEKALNNVIDLVGSIYAPHRSFCCRLVYELLASERMYANGVVLRRYLRCPGNEASARPYAHAIRRASDRNA